MLPLRDPGLARRTRRALEGYQKQVDSAGDYAARVAAGRRLFGNRSRQSNPVFRRVRGRLADICAGARRCGYCEDSAADEIEHIKPRDLYPETVFSMGELSAFLWIVQSEQEQLLCRAPRRQGRGRHEAEARPGPPAAQRRAGPDRPAPRGSLAISRS